MGFDIRVAVSASDRNTVVAVLDEVQLSDAIDVDRRHRLAALARRGDRLPPALQSVRARSKYPIKLAAAAIDGADDRVKGDLPQSEIVFRNPSEDGDHVSEGQHR